MKSVETIRRQLQKLIEKKQIAYEKTKKAELWLDKCEDKELRIQTRMEELYEELWDREVPK